MVSTPALEKRFWRQLGLAVEDSIAATRGTAVVERQDSAEDRKARVSPLR